MVINNKIQNNSEKSTRPPIDVLLINNNYNFLEVTNIQIKVLRNSWLNIIIDKHTQNFLSYSLLSTYNQTIFIVGTYLFDCTSCCDMYCNCVMDNTVAVCSTKWCVGGDMFVGFKYYGALCDHIFSKRRISISESKYDIIFITSFQLYRVSRYGILRGTSWIQTICMNSSSTYGSVLLEYKLITDEDIVTILIILVVTLYWKFVCKGNKEYFVGVNIHYSSCNKEYFYR